MPSSSLSLASQPPARTNPLAPEETELEMRDLLLVIKRHVLLILICMIVVTSAAVFHALTAKNQYSATATIEINGQSRPTLGLDDLSGGQTGSSTPELLTTDLLTQQAQLSSPSTILAVVELLKLNDTPTFAIPASISASSPLYAERALPLSQAPHQRDRVLQIFAAHLQVSIVKGTRLLEITYSSADPVEAATVANAVVSAYVDAASQSRLLASTEVSRGLADQLTALKMKVIENQKDVEDYQKQTGLAGIAMLPSTQDKAGSVQSSSTENIPVSRLLVFNQDLTNAEVARTAKESIYRMTQSEDPAAVLGIPQSPLVASLGPDSGLTAANMGLTQLQTLRTQLTQIDIDLATASTRYGPKSDTILELRNRDEATRKEITSELASIRARAKNDLDLAILSENALHKQVDGQEQLVTDWSGKVDHLLLLEGEASSSRDLYEDLYTKFQEANLASGINSTKVAILNPARTPSRPSSPKRMHDMELGVGVGLIIGIILAFVVDYFDDSIHSAAEVSKLVRLPFAAITQFPSDGGHYHGAQRWLSRRKRIPGFSIVPHAAQSCLVQEPHSTFSEAYRSARSTLLKARSVGAFRSFVVASGLPGEGRAAACFNLAVAFALLGDRVLLLDADMHGSPLSFPDDPGLSDCLLRGLPFADAIQKSPEADSLFFLPAGAVPSNPAELSCSRRFVDLLSTAKSQFDYVFIHCPSALLFSEASILSSLADGYLLVARSGKTRRQDLVRTMDLLRSPRTSLMGVLLNDTQSKPPAPALSEQFMGKRQRA